MNSISLRELVFAIAIILTALYFQLSWVGISILMGVAIAALIIRRGEPSFQLGGMCIAIGFVCLALSLYFADHYSVTFDGLRSLPRDRKFVRQLPAFGYSALTMGVLLLAYRGLGKLGEKHD